MSSWCGLWGRALIWAASNGQKMLSIRCAFHCHVFWSIKLLTVALVGSIRRGESTVDGLVRLTHLLRQMFTVVSSPILHRLPFRMMSRDWAMLRHAKKEWPRISASIKEQCGNYFALKSLWSNVFGRWSNRQPCFASKAWLNNARSLNPMPPSNFFLAHITPFLLVDFLFCFLLTLPKFANLRINLRT